MGQRTPLHGQHLALGARFVECCDWEMPPHYGSPLDERHQVRRDCGVFDASWFVARTGYTGEDGLEIMLPAAQAPDFSADLIGAGIAPSSLGARDTLRLEAGLSLYGQDMDESISPLAESLGWTLARDPEERDSIGCAAVEAQRRASGQPKLVRLLRRRVACCASARRCGWRSSASAPRWKSAAAGCPYASSGRTSSATARL